MVTQIAASCLVHASEREAGLWSSSYGSLLRPFALMAFLRCTACGSKALVAASQCPRCRHPFQLQNTRGDRVKLSRCRGCGIMHRFDATCHWCGVLPKATWPSPTVWRSAAAVLLSVTVAAAAWRYGAPSRVDLIPDQSAASVAVYSVATSDGVMPSPRVPVEARLSATAVPTRLQDRLAAPVAGAVDSIAWTPAVARTWVNVRNEASRGGEVIGVIKPAARAMLGTDRAGWRQVRSPDVTGWVDPRLFAPDSLRIRGE